MAGDPIVRFLRSVRTTIGILVSLSVLLLLNVALPQETLLGTERFEAVLEEAGPLYRFVLEDLGFGRMAASPVFLGVLGLFFLNLMVVIGSRIGPTLRRVRIKPRAEPGLRKWTGMEESLTADLPGNWTAGHAVETLRGFGYQVRQAGESTIWAVRHRTAPLGFLAFHLSFFLLCAAGALLYYSRFVGAASLVEGQEFNGAYQQVLRDPPLIRPPDLRFGLVEVMPELQDGRPMQLGAVFRFPDAAGSEDRESWINRPAKDGPAKILVHRAGLAPVLWLQDDDGYTLDRVSVMANTLGDRPTSVPVAGERYQVLIDPLAPGEPFPGRSAMPSVGLSIRVLEGERELFLGRLARGEVAEWEGGRLVLEEIRYWVAFQVVSERGGGLLIAGFTLGILGLIWRLLWYRREVALTWDDREFRLTGRGEYFSQRFHEELGWFRNYLVAGPAPRGGGT
jgi:hypothetical protein